MDEVAREYLLLGLALGEIQEGTVDAYFGPPELKQQAQEAQLTPQQVAGRAAELRGRLSELVADEQRARWLDRQLIAVETLGRLLGGDQPNFEDEVVRCFDAAPQQTPASEYQAVRRELEGLMPGTSDLRDRLAARDEALTISADRLADVIDWLADELRQRCSVIFPVPDGESLTTTTVSGQPWSAYNWYDGDLKSRVEVNTDLPVRAHAVIDTMAHETFPGHHLEHAWKEARLVRERGQMEASIQLINTPEAYISEGLAEIGTRFVAGEGDWQALLLELCARADLPMTVVDADREWHITRIMRRMRGSGGDAALLMHSQGKSRDEAIAFLEHDALRTREQAEKTLEFIDHPLWRTYVFCYAGGERLLDAWLATADDQDGRRALFMRLLTEQLTPSGIAQQLQ